ncbi:MAG: alpha/beta hydrolase [Anaerovibrio sp.]|uniref:alpha/beta fold hydrolase n=1 Tax=Anaerovibrio sp. TaxID=1872532 RepID=UPI0025CCAD9B|nr:alpha/beta hydrolase [Anaerovibrio sp.]MCR5176153.1 alpha/beta hydrolase [Anaerovibrio sp.]
MKPKQILTGMIAFLVGVMLFGGAMADGAAKNDDENNIRYFMQQPGAYKSNEAYGNNLEVGHYCQVGDARLYYEVYGQGKPVFVFHGGGVGSPYEMGQLIDNLRKNYQVIVVSTRGHGRSEIGHTRLTYEQKAEDMLTVMKEVTDEPAVLLGFSDGAYTAYKVASVCPERVNRVIAIGAGTLKPGFFSGDMKVDDLAKIDAAFIAQQKEIMPEPERYQEFCTNYMSFWSRMRVDSEFFNTITCPVLLIVGDEDDHAPVITVLAAHQAIPDSRLCVVPKAWHSAFIDNFRVTWAAIEEFMETKNVTGSKKVHYNEL